MSLPLGGLLDLKVETLPPGGVLSLRRWPIHTRGGGGPPLSLRRWPIYTRGGGGLSQLESSRPGLPGGPNPHYREGGEGRPKGRINAHALHRQPPTLKGQGGGGRAPPPIHSPYYTVEKGGPLPLYWRGVGGGTRPTGEEVEGSPLLLVERFATLTPPIYNGLSIESTLHWGPFVCEKPLHDGRVSSCVLAEVAIVTLNPRICSKISK